MDSMAAEPLEHQLPLAQQRAGVSAHLRIQMRENVNFGQRRNWEVLVDEHVPNIDKPTARRLLKTWGLAEGTWIVWRSSLWSISHRMHTKEQASQLISKSRCGKK
ncbi:Hypothetical predicted protein [Olea europaea subsp. europaea]|uniref:Uncharacterized protein n=1 Tax=Olea europaea subsp. europaea TaxID=158383 RepID=A0A8S0TIY1_OLEEU|nr:Hypothetical predicted protein [Olea europaea subsp. europaea]